MNSYGLSDAMLSTGPGSQCVSRKLASVSVRLAVPEGRKASGKPMSMRV